MKIIVFVIVIYKPCISELEDILKTLKGKNVVLVDNSERNDDKVIHQELARNLNVKLIPTNQNIGYPAGANIGISYALSKNTEWVITLTPDLTISKKQIDNYCSKISRLEPCLAGPLGGGLDRKRWTTIFSMNYSKTVDYLSGGFLSIHREVINRIGYLFNPFFMYYEDVDYSIRARKAGFRLVKIPIVDMKHNDSPVLGKESFLHQYYHARNHLLFVERQAPLNVKLREYIRLPKTLFDHYSNKEIGALRGVIDYIFRQFGQRKNYENRS